MDDVKLVKYRVVGPNEDLDIIVRERTTISKNHKLHRVRVARRRSGVRRGE